MKKIPNEGALTLDNIRQLEFGDLVDLSEFNDLSYDKNIRFTKKSDIESLMFAFTQKTIIE